MEAIRTQTSIIILTQTFCIEIKVSESFSFDCCISIINGVVDEHIHVPWPSDVYLNNNHKDAKEEILKFAKKELTKIANENNTLFYKLER